MSIMIPTIDVPLVVDAVKTHEHFPMVRCNYLYVECDSPKGGWELNLGGEALPFLMLGLVGIVTSPFGAERFNTVELIEDLFRRIEDEADLLVDIDDIWLPMFLFNNTNIVPEIGHVYRIKSDVFTLALSFREGRLDLKAFISGCRQSKRPLFLSEDEMMSFSKWHDMQVQNAKEQYPKSRDLELPWHEEGHDHIPPLEVTA